MLDARYADLIKQLLGSAVGGQRSLTQPIATPTYQDMSPFNLKAGVMPGTPVPGATQGNPGGGVGAGYADELKRALGGILAQLLAGKGGQNGMRQ